MPRQYPAAPKLTVDLDKSYTATIRTNLGDFTVALDRVQAPLAVNSWLFLAGDGFFDGVIFHRVVPGFVIQGGDPTGTGRGGPGYKFRDELEGPGKYSRGTVAMANAGPNTNGSQFFVCLDDVRLPHAYTIFGKVTSGMETVDAIAALPLNGERPAQEARIESVDVVVG